MTPRQYSNALEALELRPVDIAHLLDVTPRTHRRWAAGIAPVPQAVALVLRFMIKHGLSVDAALALLEPKKKKNRAQHAAP